jgi:hypothetical protein
MNARGVTMNNVLTVYGNARMDARNRRADIIADLVLSFVVDAKR